jgi:hypothetical protein
MLLRKFGLVEKYGASGGSGLPELFASPQLSKVSGAGKLVFAARKLETTVVR